MNVPFRFYDRRGFYHYNDFGARNILAAYAGVSPAACRRFGISHGIDGGHLAKPQDIDLPLPVHWAYNPDILARSRDFKPCLTLPHPWLLMEHENVPQPGGVLVIGPPPGESNDRALLAALRGEGIERFDILLKVRGDISRSLAFWKEAGVTVKTAGKIVDPGFYHRLSEAMAGYGTVIGCSLSSALIFAVAVGAKARMLSITIQYYEADTAPGLFTYGGDLQRFAQMAAERDDAGMHALTGHLLGEAFRVSPEAAREAIDAANEAADRNPVHLSPEARFPGLRLALAGLSGRIGILSPDMTGERVRKRLRSNDGAVCRVTINELDVAINGPGESNLRYDPVSYVHGETVPGYGL